MSLRDDDELDGHRRVGGGVDHDRILTGHTSRDGLGAVTGACAVVGRWMVGRHGARSRIGLAGAVQKSDDGRGSCRDLDRELRSGGRVQDGHDLRRGELGLDLECPDVRPALVRIDQVEVVGHVAHRERRGRVGLELELVGTAVARQRRTVLLEDGVAVAVVVVGRRAELVHPRVDVLVGVVAVARGTGRARGDRHRHGAPAVAVGITAFVDRAVARVVRAVANLGRARVDARARVVAVARQAGRARGHRHAGVAVTVTVVVAAFVDRAVARVVFAVADLEGELLAHVGLRRADRGETVCRADARAGRLADARACRARVTQVVARIDERVAVVVHAIAEFGGGGIDARVAVVAVAREALRARGDGHAAVAIAVLVVVAAFVDDTVAGVVDSVADLDDVLAGLVAHDGVAVHGADDLAVLAGVRVRPVAGRAERREVFVDLPVAVVVRAVAGLGDVHGVLVGALRARTVCLARPGSVGTQVGVGPVAGLANREGLIGLAVAVVVQAVAGLDDVLS